MIGEDGQRFLALGIEDPRYGDGTAVEEMGDTQVLWWWEAWEIWWEIEKGPFSRKLFYVNPKPKNHRVTDVFSPWFLDLESSSLDFLVTSMKCSKPCDGSTSWSSQHLYRQVTYRHAQKAFLIKALHWINNFSTKGGERKRMELDNAITLPYRATKYQTKYFSHKRKG